MDQNLDHEANQALAATQGVAAVRGAQLTTTALAALEAAGDDLPAAVSKLSAEIQAALNEPDAVKRFAIIEYLAYNLDATAKSLYGSAEAAERTLIREGYLIALNANRADGGEFTSITDLLRLSHEGEQQ